MVSIMSSMSVCSGASMVSMGSVGLRSTSSPYLRMGRMATLSPGLQAFDHGLDGVLRALLVEIIEHLAEIGMLGEDSVELVFVQTQQLGALRGGDGGRARFPGQHAHFAEKIPFAEAGQIDGTTSGAGAARIDLHL